MIYLAIRTIWTSSVCSDEYAVDLRATRGWVGREGGARYVMASSVLGCDTVLLEGIWLGFVMGQCEGKGSGRWYGGGLGRGEKLAIYTCLSAACPLRFDVGSSLHSMCAGVVKASRLTPLP